MGTHGHAIGIDFGTSTSLVAARAGRQPVEIVPLGQSTRWFPSVAGRRGSDLVVGEDADSLPSEQVIRSPKRAITKGLQTLPVAVSVCGPRTCLTVRYRDMLDDHA